MNNLDPELTRQILAAGLNGDVQGYGLGIGNYTGPSPTEANDQTANRANYEQVIYGNGQKPSWASNTWDTWNTDGTYRGAGSGDSDAMSALKFAALAAAGYGLGTGIESLGAGSAGGVSGLADGASLDAFYGAEGLGGGGSLGGSAAGGSVAAPSASLGGGSAAGTDWGAWANGEVAGASQNPATASQLNNWAISSGIAGARNGSSSGNLNWGSLLGAAAGALDGKDKTATSSKDPWAPAQPALLGLLAQGQGFMNKPAISPEMQAAYARQSGLLDYANSSAPGLFAAAQANASGANNYSRLGKGK